MHSQGFDHGFFLSSAVWTWILLLFAVIVVVLIIRAIIISRKEKEDFKELDSRQLQTLDDFEAQVMALLAQTGKPMRQTEIGKRLGLPVPVVAKRLNEMEEHGDIRRKWATDEYTYWIEKETDE